MYCSGPASVADLISPDSFAESSRLRSARYSSSTPYPAQLCRTGTILEGDFGDPRTRSLVSGTLAADTVSFIAANRLQDDGAFDRSRRWASIRSHMSVLTEAQLYARRISRSTVFVSETIRIICCTLAV